MSAPQTDVTVLVRERSRLPEWAVEYSLIVRHLLATGRLEELAKRLRIARAGYAGLDIALFLLAFFCWGKSSSLSRFGSESAGWGPQLAALAGRSAWPSASRLSRGLAVADRCDLDTFGVWLLGAGAGGTELLAHPLAMATDTHGEPWAVFDFDPTVETLRQRALPEGADLPSGCVRRGIRDGTAARPSSPSRQSPARARPCGCRPASNRATAPCQRHSKSRATRARRR